MKSIPEMLHYQVYNDSTTKARETPLHCYAYPVTVDWWDPRSSRKPEVQWKRCGCGISLKRTSSAGHQTCLFCKRLIRFLESVSVTSLASLKKQLSGSFEQLRLCVKFSEVNWQVRRLMRGQMSVECVQYSAMSDEWPRALRTELSPTQWTVVSHRLHEVFCIQRPKTKTLLGNCSLLDTVLCYWWRPRMPLR